MRFRSPVAVILLSTAGILASALPAHADEAAEQEILVIGESQGYLSVDSYTATKTDTPLIDVPQSIQVITREKLDDQASHSIADVLRYVPGVTIGQGEGNRDQITLRGQNTTADFFLDGVRDDVQYYRSLYNLERIEVLKGPYAMIFGRGGGGGIVNRVQKTPHAESLFATGAASVNTFGAWDVSADINAPMGSKAAVRLNAFYEHLDGHREFADGERYAFNPYVAFDLGDWKAGLSYEYVHDDRLADRGVPSIGGVPLEGHRDTFFGVPGINRTGFEAHIVKARLDGKLADNLDWSTTLLYGDYDKFYANVFPNSSVRLSDRTIELDGYRDDTDRENFLVQSNLVWDFDLGGVSNKMLLGLEYGSQKTTNGRVVSVTKPRIYVDSFTMPAFGFPFTSVSRATTSDVEFFSAYLQDQIHLGEHIDLIGGIRYDRFDIKGVNQVSATPFARLDEKWSPRFGLIVKPRPEMSIYASYSQSFLPRAGDQFISLTPSTQSLAPEKFTNYELGLKWDIRNGLSLTSALFLLDRTNSTTPDPANPTTTIVIGATRTKGFEVEITGRITPKWQVSGGYTWQDAYLKGNEAIRVAQVPKHQVSLWNRYDFSRRLGAGIGLIHQSSQYAALHNPGVSNATLLPSFTRVDLGLFFKATEQLQFQVNVENLFDTAYFSDAHNNNNITPGAPINARFTLRAKF
ncbi:MAG: TonB-dependent receptor [Novosphingobium sp.]